MIYIKIDDNTFYDDAIVLVRSFYPRIEVTAYKDDASNHNGICNSDNNERIDNNSSCINDNGKCSNNNSKNNMTTCNNIVKADMIIDIKVTGLNKSQMHDKFKSYLYDYLSEKTGKTLPWGYLTGVRPSKIAYVMLEDGESEDTIKKHFMGKHKASEEKAELALKVAKKEMDIIRMDTVCT